MTLIENAAETVADVVDAAVILLLVAGLIYLLVRCVRQWIDREAPRTIFVKLRLNLGQLILLALEVLIVSDILHSIAHRTLEDLAALAAIVLIRVVLAYFLDKEIHRLSSDVD